MASCCHGIVTLHQHGKTRLVVCNLCGASLPHLVSLLWDMPLASESVGGSV